MQKAKNKNFFIFIHLILNMENITLEVSGQFICLLFECENIFFYLYDFTNDIYSIHIYEIISININ